VNETHIKFFIKKTLRRTSSDFILSLPPPFPRRQNKSRERTNFITNKNQAGSNLGRVTGSLDCDVSFLKSCMQIIRFRREI
jgi:hypothetical protein